MNAETRAKEIVVEIIGGILADGAITQGSGERWTAIITNALRQAEADALAEAASEIGRYADNFHQVSKHRSALMTAIVTIQQVADHRASKKD